MADLGIENETGETVAVTLPGSTTTIYLRYPSFDEWHHLAKAHWQCEKEGKGVDAALIASTITTCLANQDGTPLAGADQAAVMKGSPKRVMALYKRCWDTVLKSDEDTIGEAEKN